MRCDETYPYTWWSGCGDKLGVFVTTLRYKTAGVQVPNRDEQYVIYPNKYDPRGYDGTLENESSFYRIDNIPYNAPNGEVLELRGDLYVEKKWENTPFYIWYGKYLFKDNTGGNEQTFTNATVDVLYRTFTECDRYLEASPKAEPRIISLKSCNFRIPCQSRLLEPRRRSVVCGGLSSKRTQCCVFVGVVCEGTTGLKQVHTVMLPCNSLPRGTWVVLQNRFASLHVVCIMFSFLTNKCRCVF